MTLTELQKYNAGLVETWEKACRVGLSGGAAWGFVLRSMQRAENNLAAELDTTRGQTAKPVTLYFTFGQCHRHFINGTVFDKDTVVQITAPDPREVMCKHFGTKWAMEYAERPDPALFPHLITLVNH